MQNRVDLDQLLARCLGSAQHSNQKKTEISALSLLLYPFQFERVTDDFSWEQRHQNKLSNLYDIGKLKIISDHVNHYFCAKDIDLANVLPSMRASVAQKEVLLRHIQKALYEIIDSKF